MYMYIGTLMFSTNVGGSGPSEWELLPVAPFSELGFGDRMSVKSIQKVEQEREMTKERVQQTERESDELQRKLDEVEQRKEKLTLQKKVMGTKQEIGWHV